MLTDAAGRFFYYGRQRTVPMAHENMDKVHSVVYVATQINGIPGSRRGLVEGKGFLMFGSVLRLQYSVSSRGISE